MSDSLSRDPSCSLVPDQTGMDVLLKDTLYSYYAHYSYGLNNYFSIESFIDGTLYREYIHSDESYRDTAHNHLR
jgi:hypothetical protein